MPDPNLRLLEEAAAKLAPFLGEIVLPSGQPIKMITAPYFLGTKMEAFRGRGQMDFMASHDLEDFVAVVDGRSTMLKEIADSPTMFASISPKQQEAFMTNLIFSMRFRDLF